jgi:hypothetical protein
MTIERWIGDAPDASHRIAARVVKDNAPDIAGLLERLACGPDRDVPRECRTAVAEFRAAAREQMDYERGEAEWAAAVA